MSSARRGSLNRGEWAKGRLHRRALDSPLARCHEAFMREKELRIALVCYGGVSLAVYMHGITKEIWRLAKASQAAHSSDPKEAEAAAAGSIYSPAC